MADERRRLLALYRSMHTEELIALDSNGDLTQVAAGVLSEVLKERGVTEDQRSSASVELKAAAELKSWESQRPGRLSCGLGQSLCCSIV
jgi:hypothetical protein